MERLATILSNHLLSRNIIRQEQFDDHVYGVQVILSNLLPMIISLMLATVFGYIPEMCLFILFFIPARTLAGGYHARHFLTCLILFIIVEMIFFLTLFMIPHFGQLIILTFGISLPILISLTGTLRIILATSNNSGVLVDEFPKFRYLIYLFEMIIILVIYMFSKISFQMFFSACFGIGVAALAFIYRYFIRKGE